MQQLPLDVQKEILKLLNGFSLLQLSMVNRHFRDLIASQESLQNVMKSQIVTNFIFNLIPTGNAVELIHNLDDWVAHHCSVKISQKSKTFVRTLTEYIRSNLFPTKQSGLARRKCLLKLILLGDSGVGKTSLIHKYLYKSFTNHYKATIGGGLITKEMMIGNHLITNQVWDTAGQERFQSLGVAFYRGADAVIVTYDLMSLSTLQNIESWIEEFYSSNSGSLRSHHVPIILCGNKLDLYTHPKTPHKEPHRKKKTPSNRKESPIEPVTEQDIEQLAQKLHIPWIHTSAKDGINVELLFELATVLGFITDKITDQNPEDEFLPTVDLNPVPSIWNLYGCPC